MKKPVKKFPCPKAISFKDIEIMLKEKYNIDVRKNHKNIHDFLNDKFYDKLVFPKHSLYDEGVRLHQEEVKKNKWRLVPKFTSSPFKMIYGECVIALPKSYDSSNDKDNYKKKKENFKKEMKKITGKEVSKENLEYVSFGNSSYDWVNEILDIIYKEFSEYYVDDHLNVWFMQDFDYEFNSLDYDYPHKRDICGNIVNPEGVYFYSDIVAYIEDKYGLKDDMLYDFIIENQYIEQRHWERVWTLILDKDDEESQYGMECTESISHILDVIKLEFKDDIKQTSEGNRLDIYMDEFKYLKY